MSTGLKPGCSACTVYRPGGSRGIVNSPSLLAVPLPFRPVAVFVAVTRAPGTTAPDESETVPLKVAVADWPCAQGAPRKPHDPNRIAGSMWRIHKAFIETPGEENNTFSSDFGLKG